MSTVSATEFPTQQLSLNVEGGEVYQMLAEHLVSTLKLVRNTVETYLEGLSDAEKARAQHAIEQMNDYIKKL